MRLPALLGGLVLALVLAPGCKGKSKAGANKDATTVMVSPQRQAAARGGNPPPMRPPQIEAPLPVAQPPADAEKISGVENAPHAVIYIKRLKPGSGERPGRNDTVKVNFTGWRTSGETYVSTTVRKRPVTQSLAVLAPGFAVAVASMQPGERAMMWIPPELGYLGQPTDTPETTVYEVELVSFERGPVTPSDVANPPAGAKKTASGIPYTQVKAGTGKVKPRSYDLVELAYSAWSSSGRLFDSSEVTKQPRRSFPFAEPLAVEEVLRTMVVGQRVRLWLPATQLDKLPTTPDGQVCYEVELLAVSPKTAPPPTPADVAAPPATAARTPRGVAYRVLKPGTGTVHPVASDRLKVHYTGWLTSGRVFDSSEVRGGPEAIVSSKMFPGWAEAMATMTVGGRSRFWIPVELAYDNKPGAPPGMLVFEVELLEILQPPARGK